MDLLFRLLWARALHKASGVRERAAEGDQAKTQTLRAPKVGKAELARRLNCHLPQMTAYWIFTHSSRLDQLESEFHALGNRLAIVVHAFA